MLCSTKYNKVKFFTFIIFLLCLLLTDLKTISAQDITFGNFIKIEQADIKTGMIISKKGQEFIKSDKEYDNNVIGVINNNSDITLEPLDPTENNLYLLTTSGIANVLVSAINGPIKKGDYITTSNIPGIGMKANTTGFVIGTALSDFNPSNKETITLLPVNLDIKYVSIYNSPIGTLSRLTNWTKNITYQEPLIAFKYIVATVIIILSTIFSFIHFGRTGSKGIEALGRNPLAKQSIQFGIFLNIILGIFIIIGGIFIGLLVLQF